MKFKNSIVSGAASLVLIAGLSACGSMGDGTSSTPAASVAASNEANAQGQDSANLVNNQPIPVFKFSQARQTLINAEDIEANGENTTTFGLSNTGTEVWHCDSIGMPVPADAQLSNPDQQVAEPDGGGYQENSGDNVIAQMDPIGFYTGPTTGTYTLCVNPAGQQYLQYWEGLTDAVSGPAVYANGQVTLQGVPVSISKVPESK